MSDITMNYKGVELDMNYFLQPEEKAETGPEAQYPGCGASIEVNSIKLAGNDLTELLEDQYEAIEEAIMEELGSRSEY